jgi:O-antigen/teichoic acid export membrane protein
MSSPPDMLGSKIGSAWGALRAWFGETDGLGRSLSNGTWMLIERMLAMCSAIVVSVWVARYLGPHEFGVLSYAVAFVALFTPLAALGINNILVKELVLDRERERVLLGSALIARFLGTAAAISICVAAIYYVQGAEQGADRKLFWAVVALSLATVFNALDVAGLWLQSKQAVRSLMFWKMSVTVCAALARVVALTSGAEVFTFVWIAAAETMAIDVVNLCAYYGARERPQRWQSSRTTMTGLFSKSWPLILSSIAASIYLKIDQVMLANMVSVTESGVYAVAARMSEVWYFIPQLLAGALFPSLLRTKLVSADLYKQRMRMCLAAFAMAATAIAVFITIFADPIVLTLFGHQYAGAAVILQIHIWGGIFIFQRAVASKWMIAEDLFMFSFVSHGVGALLNIVLNLIMIPYWGGIGSAIATVISYAGASYLFTFCSRRTWPMARMMTETMLLPLSLPYALLRTRISKGRKS